jgi:hypothetical protein
MPFSVGDRDDQKVSGNYQKLSLLEEVKQGRQQHGDNDKNTYDHHNALAAANSLPTFLREWGFLLFFLLSHISLLNYKSNEKKGQTLIFNRDIF